MSSGVIGAFRVKISWGYLVSLQTMLKKNAFYSYVFGIFDVMKFGIKENGYSTV